MRGTPTLPGNDPRGRANIGRQEGCGPQRSGIKGAESQTCTRRTPSKVRGKACFLQSEVAGHPHACSVHFSLIYRDDSKVRSNAGDREQVNMVG